MDVGTIAVAEIPVCDDRGENITVTELLGKVGVREQCQSVSKTGDPKN